MYVIKRRVTVGFSRRFLLHEVS